MQNRRRRLRVLLILILFVDTFLINYGSCAPTKSESINDSQKVKRSAGFMNYLSSIIYKASSLNYPDHSWNFYETQPNHQTPPESNYFTNFVQYLDENNYEDENYINWPPEPEMKEINYFQNIPNDPPPPAVVTYIGNDDFILENDCGCDKNGVENNMNWNIPPHGIDESIFHNFYLLPGDKDISTECNPATTTAKPEEEEKTPNISIFDCSSNPVQKDFLEKVLSNDNDEYVVLLIKRNPFLLGTEQENKTEIVLQPPPSDQTQLDPSSINRTPFTEDIQVDEVVFEEPIKSSENDEPLEIPGTIDNKVTGIVDLEFISSSKQESSTDTPASTVATYIRTQEDPTQKSSTDIPSSMVSTYIRTQEDPTQKSSTDIPTSTVLTNIRTQEDPTQKSSTDIPSSTVSTYIRTQEDPTQASSTDIPTSTVATYIRAQEDPTQKSSTDIPSSMVSTYTKTQEDLSQKIEDVAIEELDKFSDLTKNEQDIQETISTESEMIISDSTLPTPIATPTDEDVINLENPINEGNGINLTTEAQTESNKTIVKIHIKDNVDSEVVKHVEIPTKVEKDIEALADEKVSKVAVEANDSNSKGDSENGLLSENELQITQKHQIIEPEIIKPQEDSIDIQIPIVSIENPDEISEDISTTTISSQIENITLQGEQISEGTVISVDLNSQDVQVKSESPSSSENSISVNNNEVSTAEVIKVKENDVDSISTTITPKPADIVVSIVSD